MSAPTGGEVVARLAAYLAKLDAEQGDWVAGARYVPLAGVEALLAAVAQLPPVNADDAGMALIRLAGHSEGYAEGHAAGALYGAEAVEALERESREVERLTRLLGAFVATADAARAVLALAHEGLGAGD